MAYNKKPLASMHGYIEQLKYTTGRRDKEIAKALGITPSGWAQSKTRLDGLEAITIFKLAKFLGQRPAEMFEKIINMRLTDDAINVL